MSDLATRLQDKLYEQRLSVNAFSKKVGVSQQAISKIIRGETLNPKNILEIAAALGVNAHWLKTGEGEPDSQSVIRVVNMQEPINQNTVRVEILEVEASAGNGVFLTGTEQGLLAQEFDIDFFREKFGRSNSNTLKIITVCGDSMYPTLSSGDILYVDISERSFSFDGLYVFTYGEQIFIKRLQKVGHKLLVISDNPAYEKWEITDDEGLFIHGRVVFSLPMEMRKW
ncbi:transcriptional regulator [Rodentibacter genomosp. 1]|uniref:Transcriptional regulator n=1 Tax=Rodentibacter genomosp. 1 TaxID=1908264 RepID=A0A1V3JA05_9PAST|nr:helix-turn-helix transcriptional regulator [Rodentibacter genomosp. 1]OOF51943.1 transcriptional regulator [Rodentibacter genomosp. 1]